MSAIDNVYARRRRLTKALQAHISSCSAGHVHMTDLRQAKLDLIIWQGSIEQTAITMHRLKAALLLLTSLSVAVHAASEPGKLHRTDAAQADRVVELPGARAEDLTFDLYSGWVFAMPSCTLDLLSLAHTRHKVPCLWISLHPAAGM